MTNIYTSKNNSESTNYIKIGVHVNKDLNSIVIFKANTNYTEVYFEDGTYFLSSTNLGKFENQLTNKAFFRPNRSVLVNLDFVLKCNFSEMGLGQILLKNEMLIPISRRKIQLFLKKFQPKNEI
jgi:DNA-binding LytR/AlgR family response regulator